MNINLGLASLGGRYITWHASIGPATPATNALVTWFGSIPFLHSTFGKLRFFFLAFIPSHLVFVPALAYWDTKKGIYGHDRIRPADWNPPYGDLPYCLGGMRERLGDEQIRSAAARWTASGVSASTALGTTAGRYGCRR